MEIERIKEKDLDCQRFIKESVEKISAEVGEDIAVIAVSGGVDSAVTAVLGFRALGKRLSACFINTGFMRAGEPKNVISQFKKLGIEVELIDAQINFLNALAEATDAQEKRNIVADVFYRRVFGPFVKKIGAKFLLQGTIYPDAAETASGYKRHHNVFSQIGIDPHKEFGYQIIEPLLPLCKDGVRKVAKALTLPEEIYNRMPFPGPGLAIRVFGEVTFEKISLIRIAHSILDEELGNLDLKPFQWMAILHQEEFSGQTIAEIGALGRLIEIRCWDSEDALVAEPTKVPRRIIDKIGSRMISEIPNIVNVVWNMTPKPPSSIEAM